MPLPTEVLTRARRLANRGYRAYWLYTGEDNEDMLGFGTKEDLKDRVLDSYELEVFPDNWELLELSTSDFADIFGA